jgi:hypothetical protein
MKPFDTKNNHLVAEIVTNNKFLSLHWIWWLPLSPPTKKELKNDENKVWYQNEIYEKYRD